MQNYSFFNYKYSKSNKLMYIIGSKIINLDKINSTNDFASTLLSKDKQPEGTIVLTEYQTNGKGQGSNIWYSSKGENILMSLILYPEFLDVSKQFYLSEMVTLSIIKMIEENLNLECKIKWPNDIFLNNKKIGGVLIKNSIKGQKIKNSVIGIGLNVNQKKFSKELPNAGSLAIESGKELDKQELFYALLKNLDEYYIRLKNKGFDKIKQEFVLKLLGYNSVLKCQSKDGERFNAKIETVKETGEIVLNVNNELRSFMHGQIRFII